MPAEVCAARSLREYNRLPRSQPMRSAPWMVVFGISLLNQLAAAQAPLPWIRVAADQNGFVIGETNEPFIPWGFNYDHDEKGRLIEDYWSDEWPKVEQDFAEMKALGANVVRVHLQFGKFMEADRKSVV